MSNQQAWLLLLLHHRLSYLTSPCFASSSSPSLICGVCLCYDVDGDDDDGSGGASSVSNAGDDGDNLDDDDDYKKATPSSSTPPPSSSPSSAVGQSRRDTGIRSAKARQLVRRLRPHPEANQRAGKPIYNCLNSIHTHFILHI